MNPGLQGPTTLVPWQVACQIPGADPGFFLNGGGGGGGGGCTTKERRS